MNNTTALNASGRVARTFSVSEFMDFGERYGIDYRFPLLAQRPDLPSGSPVLQGEIEEMTLPCGMCVTHSDVQVLQPYETTSRHDSPLYMLVVLEGCVILTLNGQEHVVRSGMAFSSRLSEHQTMRARHHADCKLRTLSLGLYPDGAYRTGLLESLMREWERCQTPTLIWQVPGFLLSGLQYAQQSTISHVSRQLMLEGLILQLFGHGLSMCQVESGKRLATSGEQQRLEVVRWNMRAAIYWKDIAYSRRPGCRVISMPPTFLPLFVVVTAFRPAICSNLANPYLRFTHVIS